MSVSVLVRVRAGVILGGAGMCAVIFHALTDAHVVRPIAILCFGSRRQARVQHTEHVTGLVR